MPTTFSSVKVTGKSTFGSNLTAGLVSAAVAGSLIMAGNTYVDRGQNVSVNNYYGTGSYMSYDDTVCTNTGGLAKYTACSWQNPSSTNTGVLLRLQLDSEAAPTGATATCSTSPDGSATGTVLFKYQTTASGHALITNPRGRGAVSSGAIVVPPSHYVRCWHSATPGPGLKEQLRVWYDGYYTP